MAITFVGDGPNEDERNRTKFTLMTAIPTASFVIRQGVKSSDYARRLRARTIEVCGENCKIHIERLKADGEVKNAREIDELIAELRRLASWAPLP